MTNYPTAWQRRAIWTSATVIAVVAVGVIAVWLVYYLGKAIGFLQPVLIPFAVAAVLAFLLDPIVRFIINRTRLSRNSAVLVVFAMLALLLGLLLVSVVPRIYRSTASIVHDLPAYSRKAQERIVGLVDSTQKQIDKLNNALPGHPPDGLEAAPRPGDAPRPIDPDLPGANVSAPPPANPAAEETKELPGGSDLRDWLQQQIPELGKGLPALLGRTAQILMHSVGGALGLFGTLLNVIIIPVYLYFLMTAGPEIGRQWKDYVPLRDSPVKGEVVGVLTEVNGYLVAFFRGQLLVCIIDGILIGTSLAIMGLDFAFFIGLLVVFLTIIPYLGIVLCYIPVILIAIVQYGDLKHVALVVGIMFTVQTLEGYVIAPKIVGESTGLHSLTVIVSVFFWSLLLEGPIGAILAVPLTATLKVLARRYLWERNRHRSRLVPVEESAPVMAAGGTSAVGPGGLVEPSAAAATK